MSVKQYISASIIKLEPITVELVEKELIAVNLQTIDMIQDRDWVVQTIKDSFVYNEVPTKLTLKRFRADNQYVETSLTVYFNGIKEKNITIHSTLEFSLPIDTNSDDDVEIDYIKA